MNTRVFQTPKQYKGNGFVLVQITLNDNTHLNGKPCFISLLCQEQYNNKTKTKPVYDSFDAEEKLDRTHNHNIPTVPRTHGPQENN